MKNQCGVIAGLCLYLQEWEFRQDQLGAKRQHEATAAAEGVGDYARVFEAGQSGQPRTRRQKALL